MSFRRRLPFAIAPLALVAGAVAACSSSSDTNASPPSAAGSDAGAAGDGAARGDAATTTTTGGEAGPALPTTAFLFVHRTSAQAYTLRAHDTATGETRVVTDLTGDGSGGWPIEGVALSPDRTRIVLSTLYGPTAADNATNLATRRLWSLRTDGTDFTRLTPVYPNDGAGKKDFAIAVSDPVFTKDGSHVLYGYGEYWTVGQQLAGGSTIFGVPTTPDGQAPAAFNALTSCSLVHPSVRPTTGEVAIVGSLCTTGGDGIYLYKETGGGGTPLVQESAQLKMALSTPSWAFDGSGFLFTGLVTVGNQPVRSLLAYDMDTKQSTNVIVPNDGVSSVESATFAPDAKKIVYTLRTGDARNLHLIDLGKTPATDEVLTTDGLSELPVW